jgi:hypothetical protein
MKRHTFNDIKDRLTFSNEGAYYASGGMILTFNGALVACIWSNDVVRRENGVTAKNLVLVVLTDNNELYVRTDLPLEWMLYQPVEL